jgi:O-antigen ligase
LAEVITFWAANGLGWWVARDHSTFWGGYASTGSLMIPLLLGGLLVAPSRRGTAVAGWALLCVAAALIFLYGSRTPFLVVGGATLLLFVLLKKWRGVLAISLVAALFAALVQMAPVGPLEKYRSLLKSETYVTNSGLSLRLSVWEGCWQVIADRPLTGYGHGWKKLAWAINDKGLAERWSSERPDLAAYYLTDGKASYGKVNPHNYLLQVMFEIGAVGLLLAIAFWFAVIRDSVRLLGNREKGMRDLAACLMATLGAYALTNLTNGQWVGGLANLSLAFAGCLLAIARLAPTDVQPQAHG